MAVNRIKFERFLAEQYLLQDEKDMWCTLGFYVYPHPSIGTNTPSPRTLMVDAVLNEVHMHPTKASNIRACILEWWEKKTHRNSISKGKSSHINFDSLDELEEKREQ
jgi:hypothetical protein